MEENKLNQKNGNTGVGIIIGALLMLVICLGGYFVYNEFIKKDDIPNKDNKNTTEKKEEEIAYKDFVYDKYKLNLVTNIKNTNDIYAFDLDVNLDNSITDIYIRYTNEEIIKIATVKANNGIEVEYRTLGFENNKLYYIIGSKDEGEVFELDYIDFNNLSAGAKTLEDFNKVFIRDNLWEVGSTKTIYSTKIYVNDNDIYYTSFNDKSLKTYNMKTKTTKTIVNNIDWYGYYIDTVNDKLFYYSNDEKKAILADLNGQKIKELEKEWSGSYVEAMYNGMPVFESGVYELIDSDSIIDLYTYDYKTNTYTKIKENITSNYKVKHNKIEENVPSKDDGSFTRSFVIK